MTGVVGALVALAVVVALVLVLAVRPHVRRLTRSVATLRADTTAAVERLQTIRSARSRTPGPPRAAGEPSPIGGPGPHRPADAAPEAPKGRSPEQNTAGGPTRPPGVGLGGGSDAR